MMRNICLWVALVLVLSLPSIAASYLTNDTDIDAIDEILVEEDSLTIADLRFEIAPTVPELRDLLGRPDRATDLPPSQDRGDKPNKIYIWDSLGFYVYKETYSYESKPSTQFGERVGEAPVMSKKTTKEEVLAHPYGSLITPPENLVRAIAVDFAQRSGEFSPKEAFVGRIVVGRHVLSNETTIEDLRAAGFSYAYSHVYCLTVGKLRLYAELVDIGTPQAIATLRISTIGLWNTTTPIPTPAPTPVPTPRQCLSWSWEIMWREVSNDTVEIHVTVSVDNNCSATIPEVSCYAAMDAEAAGRVWDQEETLAFDIHSHGMYPFWFRFTCPMHVWTRLVTEIRVSGSVLGRSEGDWFRTE